VSGVPLTLMIHSVDNSSNAAPKSSNGGVSAGSGASFASALASATQQTQASDPASGSVTEGLNTDQIGRASCRERV